MYLMKKYSNIIILIQHNNNNNVPERKTDKTCT